MKKLIFLIAILFVGSAITYAENPTRDTIKVYSGNKTIIIVSKSKKSDQSDLEFGKKTFEDKINQYEDKIDSIEKVIDSLTSVLDNSKDSSNTLLSEKLEELKKQEANYQKMIAALEKGVSDIEKQLDEMDKEQQKETSPQPDEKQENTVKTRRHHRKFKGHWAGLEFGPNSFLTPSKQLVDNSNNTTLAPDLNKSFEFNLNLLEGNVKIFNFFGLVSGLGLQWNNYKYETFPTYSSSYVLNTDSLYPISQADGSTLKQISLKTLYINVPLLVELQFPFGSSNRFYVNFGGFAGLNIYSKLKFIYNLSGNRIKSKEDIAKMIMPYQYGLTARIGIDQIQLYANYNLSPIFRSTQNPVLYPVSVGLHLNF